MDSKILYAAAVAALVAVSSFAGVAYAADEPAAAPGPGSATSGAAALSSSLFAAVVCPAVALLFANLRQ